MLNYESTAKRVLIKVVLFFVLTASADNNLVITITSIKKSESGDFITEQKLVLVT